VAKGGQNRLRTIEWECCQQLRCAEHLLTIFEPLGAAVLDRIRPQSVPKPYNSRRRYIAVIVVAGGVYQPPFNSRLKFYDCLGGLFRHGVAKHKAAFEAVCVTLQYAMDLGEPIFDVVHHHHDGKRQQQPNRNKRFKEAAQMQ
jgi:hypothetical protein